MSSPVDWVVLEQVIERYNVRQRQEPCPEDRAHASRLRNYYTYGTPRYSPIVAWTLSQELTTPPAYTQPEPVSGEFEARQ
jgi:hypothetical protein